MNSLERDCGPQGSLAGLVGVCNNLNDSLTRINDSILGADGTDAFDASCNTCKHFQRKPMTGEEKANRNIYGMPGRCEKKDIAVTGWQRGQFCGFENAACYENRRTEMTHAGISAQIKDFMAGLDKKEEQ